MSQKAQSKKSFLLFGLKASLNFKFLFKLIIKFFDFLGHLRALKNKSLKNMKESGPFLLNVQSALRTPKNPTHAHTLHILLNWVFHPCRNL